jgi:hypothetical protein
VPAKATLLRPALVAVVFAALSTLAGSRAFASCGDYLQGATVDAQHPGQMPTKHTCHGPQCRKNSLPVPLRERPATPRKHSEHSVLTESDAQRRTDSSSCWRLAASGSSHAGYPMRVDRPPCA